MHEFFAYISSESEMVLTAIGEHLAISLTAVALGFLVAFPVGVFLSGRKKAASVVLSIFSAVNTIPSIVLLGVAMMILGLGFLPAVAVLFLYSLLPVMRNTCTGLNEVEEKYIRAAKGMGMSRIQVLIKVQIPLALPVIIAGVRLSTIYIISWATLATFIGGGGLGDLIWMGLQSYNFDLVLCGAVPATLLAFAFSVLFSVAEKFALRSISKGGRAS